MSEQDIIDTWNKQHPVGTAVVYKHDDGRNIVSSTRSEAELLGGHTPVVWLTGVSGCYALDKVVAVE